MFDYKGNPKYRNCSKCSYEVHYQSMFPYKGNWICQDCKDRLMESLKSLRVEKEQTPVEVQELINRIDDSADDHDISI